jgi:hypothetical protein
MLRGDGLESLFRRLQWQMWHDGTASRAQITAK